MKRGQGGQSDGPGNMQSFTLGLTQRYQDIKNDVSSSEGYTSQEIDSVMRSLAEQLNTYMENVNSYGNDFHVDPKSFFMKKSWDDFINLHVLSEKAKDIGIKIPNNQIKSLESRGQAQVSDFAEEILLANTYLKLLEKGSYSNHIDSTLIARSQNTSIRYVKVPYTLINDIDVTQQEIEDYYQTNIDDYQSDIQTKELEYILLNVSSSEKDEQLAYEYLLKKYTSIKN